MTQSCLTRDDIDFIWKLKDEGLSNCAVERRTGFSTSVVQKVVAGGKSYTPSSFAKRPYLPAWKITELMRTWRVAC
jgi:hypothetical protein